MYSFLKMDDVKFGFPAQFSRSHLCNQIHLSNFRPINVNGLYGGGEEERRLVAGLKWKHMRLRARSPDNNNNVCGLGFSLQKKFHTREPAESAAQEEAGGGPNGGVEDKNHDSSRGGVVG